MPGANRHAIGVFSQLVCSGACVLKLAQHVLEFLQALDGRPESLTVNRLEELEQVAQPFALNP